MYESAHQYERTNNRPASAKSRNKFSFSRLDSILNFRRSRWLEVEHNVRLFACYCEQRGKIIVTMMAAASKDGFSYCKHFCDKGMKSFIYHMVKHSLTKLYTSFKGLEPNITILGLLLLQHLIKLVPRLLVVGHEDALWDNLDNETKMVLRRNFETFYLLDH